VSVAITTAIAGLAFPTIIGLAVYVPFAAMERTKLQGCLDSASIAGAVNAATDPIGTAGRYAVANGCPAAVISFDGASVTADASGGLFLPIAAHARARIGPPVALIE